MALAERTVSALPAGAGPARASAWKRTAESLRIFASSRVALVGLGLVYAAPRLYLWLWDANLPAKLHVLSIFLALGVSITVGVLFGWYPARRAALLDPIEALRHE